MPSDDPTVTHAEELSRLPVPGTHLVGGGVETSVYAPRATRVEICLFGTKGDPAAERRVRLTQRHKGWWYGRVDGVGAGERYGLRVDGPWDPGAGHRHNPAKVLLDPYARAVDRVVEDYPPALFAHRGGAPRRRRPGGLRLGRGPPAATRSRTASSTRCTSAR